jgi:hypothetical protein
MDETVSCMALMPPVEKLKPPKSVHNQHPSVEAVGQSEMKRQCLASQHEQELAEVLNPNCHASAVHWTSSGSVC